MNRWSVKGPTIFDNARNYGGEDLSHLLVVPVSRSRDSGPLDESNFEEALRPRDIARHLREVHGIEPTSARKGYEREVWSRQHETEHF